MAQLPPAPAGVDLGGAEQYIVPQPSDLGTDHVTWTVDSGWYWLVQSIAGPLFITALATPGISPLVLALDGDGQLLMSASGPQIVNDAVGESQGYLQATPDAGPGGQAVVNATIALPTLWLPPGATVTLQLIAPDGGPLNSLPAGSTMIVTRAQYTGGSQTSSPDETPLPTPIVP